MLRESSVASVPWKPHKPANYSNEAGVSQHETEARETAKKTEQNASEKEKNTQKARVSFIFSN